MSDKFLYGYTGLFDNPNAIIEAAEKTSDAGYTKYDVNTPYPVHGMDKAMKLKRSKLGYFALVFGLSGAAFALLIMTWMVVFDYPLVIGGKHPFAFPAFVPIIFEVTVLSASLGTVAAMIALFFKFPNNSHPLHDTDYMKAVSSDKYGIVIEADDPLFEETKVKEFFTGLGASDITPVYYTEEEINEKPTIFEPKFIMGQIAIGLITSALIYFTLNILMYLPPFDWMAEQEKLIPQEYTTVFEDGFSMRLPVEGTVARGHMPYEFFGKPDEAAVNLVNPLLPSKENLALGEDKFNTFCSPCHGWHGEGDSRLQGQFPNPPSLHSEKVRNWTDGRIYHVIMEGQNSMPSYRSLMTKEERWASVLYVRALQRALNAKESDL